MKVGLNPGFYFACYGDKVYFNEVLEGAKRAAQIGFDTLRLEVYDDTQYEVYTPENLKLIRNHYESLGLTSDYFVACAPREKLATMDKTIRIQGLKEFSKIVDIAAEFGLANTVSLVSGAPKEAVVSHLDTYPGAPPAMVILPDDIKWEDAWKQYVDTVSQCVQMCERKGLRLSLEPLPMTIVSNTDCFLNLWSEIRSKSLGIFIDTSHLHYQRESLPLCFEKCKGLIYGVSACDNYGIEDYHYAPGNGTIDWKACVKALKKVGYTGTLDLEINVCDNPEAEYLNAKVYLDSILADAEAL